MRYYLIVNKLHSFWVFQKNMFVNIFLTFEQFAANTASKFHSWFHFNCILVQEFFPLSKRTLVRIIAIQNLQGEDFNTYSSKLFPPSNLILARVDSGSSLMFIL